MNKKLSTPQIVIINLCSLTLFIFFICKVIDSHIFHLLLQNSFPPNDPLWNNEKLEKLRSKDAIKLPIVLFGLFYSMSQIRKIVTREYEKEKNNSKIPTLKRAIIIWLTVTIIGLISYTFSYLIIPMIFLANQLESISDNLDILYCIFLFLYFGSSQFYEFKKKRFIDIKNS